MRNRWIHKPRAWLTLLGLLALSCAALGGCRPPPFVPAPPPRPAPALPEAQSPRFHQVRTLATHNSYAMSFGSWIDVEQESSNSYIMDQLLYHRVRAFELDLHPPSNFAVFHGIALQSNCQTLAECFEIFAGYHRMNPEHDVITIYIHLLEHFSSVSGPNSMEDLDKLIRTKFGSLVYTPQQAIERCPSSTGASPAFRVRDAVKKCAWPTMAELRGKFIFAIHQAGIPESESPLYNNIRGYREAYTSTRQVFIGGTGTQHDNRRDVFIVDASNALYPTYQTWKQENVIMRAWGPVKFDELQQGAPIFHQHIMLNGLFNNFDGRESGTVDMHWMWPSNRPGIERMPWDYNNLRWLDHTSMLPLFTWSYQCLPEGSLSNPTYPAGCVQGPPAFRNGDPAKEPFLYLAYWPEPGQSVWIQGRNKSDDKFHYSFYALQETAPEDPFLNLTASISAPSGFQTTYKELDTDDVTDTLPAHNRKRLDRGCLMARASAAPDADYFAICRHNFIDSIEILYRKKGGGEQELEKFLPYEGDGLSVYVGSIAPENVKIYAQLEQTSQTSNCYRGLVTNDGARGATERRGLRWEASKPVCFDAPLSLVGLAVRSQAWTHAGYLFGNVKRNAGLVNATGFGETIISAEALRRFEIGDIAYSLARDRTYLPSGEYDFATSHSPGQADPLDVRRIDAGPFHTCAIAPSTDPTVTVGGQVQCWGDNRFGQLGDGSNVRRTEPVFVLTSKGARLDRVIEISAGGDCGAAAGPCTPQHPQYMAHTCALVAPGVIDGVDHPRNTVWCWGANTYRQLGNNGTTDSRVPVLVNTSAIQRGVTGISSGGYHNCLNASGAVYCWGRNDNKQSVNSTDPVVPHPVTSIALPTEGTSRRRPAMAVRTGGEHSCAVYAAVLPDFYGGYQDAPWETPPRKIVCWGSNTSGQGGSQATVLGLWTPAPASGAPVFPTQLALGSKASVMIGTTVHYGAYQGSQLWGWGANTDNMLVADHAQLHSPYPILNGHSASYQSTVSQDITVGWSHVCYTQRPGAAPGAEHQIWCSGSDRTRAAGEASVQQRVNPPGVGRPIELTAGVRHSCAIYQDPSAPADWARSRIACWGDNSSGQLGVKGSKAEPEPVLLSSP